MRKEPECPQGHGPLEFRAIEERHFEDGKSITTAVWACPQCGYHDAHPASEFEEVRRVCDFCSRPDPVKVYPCGDFRYVIAVINDQDVLLSQPAQSIGEWIACALCAALIDANDRPGLTERVVDNMASALIRGDPRKREVVADSLRQLHAEFFARRILKP